MILEIIPGSAFLMRRWVQTLCSLDPEKLACQVMDETDGRWAVHRGFRGLPVYDRITCRFGAKGVTSTFGGRKQPVVEWRGDGILASLASSLTMDLDTSDRPFNFVYGNVYVDGGANIRKHCDMGFLELSPITTIAAVSLGQERKFQLWNRKDRSTVHEVTLEPGDLCVMHGRCQLEWLHAIPKEKGITEPRLSLTFRHHRHVDPAVIREVIRRGRAT